MPFKTFFTDKPCTHQCQQEAWRDGERRTLCNIRSAAEHCLAVAVTRALAVTDDSLQRCFREPTQVQQRFTVWQLAVDWHELMIRAVHSAAIRCPRWRTLDPPAQSADIPPPDHSATLGLHPVARELLLISRQCRINYMVQVVHLNRGL